MTEWQEVHSAYIEVDLLEDCTSALASQGEGCKLKAVHQNCVLGRCAHLHTATPLLQHSNYLP